MNLDKEPTLASATTPRRNTPSNRIAKAFSRPFKNIADFIFPARVIRRQKKHEMKLRATETEESYLELNHDEDNVVEPTVAGVAESTLTIKTTEANAARQEIELKGELYRETNLLDESAEEPVFDDPVESTKAHVNREESEEGPAECISRALVNESPATREDIEEATAECKCRALVVYNHNQPQQPSLTQVHPAMIDSGLALNDADAGSISARFQLMMAQLAAGNLTGLLGIDADLTFAQVTPDVVKRAKWRLQLDFHPDRNPGANKEEIAQLCDISAMVTNAAVDLVGAMEALSEFERGVKDINILSKPAVDVLLADLAHLSSDPWCLKAFEWAYRLVLLAGPRAYFVESAFQLIYMQDGTLLFRKTLLDIQSAILVDASTPLSISLLNMELMMLLPSRYSPKTQEELGKLREVSYYRQCTSIQNILTHSVWPTREFGCRQQGATP
jgi:hypothetical protein